MKKAAAALFAVLWIVLTMCACASASDKMSDGGGYRTESSGAASYTPAEPATDEYWGEYEKDVNASSSAEFTTNFQNSDFQNYKIIYSANMELVSRDFDGTLSQIYDLLSRYGGYVSSFSIDGTKPEQYGDSGRYARFEIRVRAENLDAFLNDTGSAAEVISKNLSSDDVTSSYFDTESRLKMYQTQYDRILEIMKKAETVEELLALEQELSRISYEMDYLTGDLKRWDDLIAYSTVRLFISEKNTFTTVETAEGFGERVSEGFMGTLSGVGKFFTELGAALIIYSPIILLILALVFFILLTIRLATRPKKAKKAARSLPVSSDAQNPEQK